MNEQRNFDNSMSAIADAAVIQISRIANDCTNDEKSLSQGAAEALEAATVVDIAQDDKFRKNLQKHKKEEIESGFEADSLTQQARRLHAKQLKREAFYTQFRPILELDFSNITGIEPKRKLKNDEKTKSYSMAIMLITLSYSIVLFLIGSVILMAIKLVESVCDFVVSLGGKATKVVAFLFIITIIILAIFIILTMLSNFFGWGII